VFSYLPSEESDAQEVVQLIKEAGRIALAVPGALKDEAYCQQVVAQAVQQLDGLDILVNVAGKQQEVDDIAHLSTRQFDETFKTNVYAMFWVCKVCLLGVLSLPPPRSRLQSKPNLAGLCGYQSCN
jgi:NAD(P)-dependent dehydrogenase (short-subunit alcohol dehydrogenase family)